MTDIPKKVVTLMPNKKDGGSVSIRQTAPLVKLQEKSRQLLASLLQEVFDQADDALFELADKADSNLEQNLYFESMREVRIKRRGIEKRFGESIGEAFRVIHAEGGSVPQSTPLRQAAAEGLSLVEHDALEELVAIDSMISKAMGQYPMLLAQLTARIDSLVPSKVDSRRNPIGPTVVCNAFLDACQDLDIGIKAKLVFFKLFERYVTGGMGRMLEEANNFLISEGVLPHLRADQVQSRNRSQNLVEAPAVDTVATESGLLAELNGLFGQSSYSASQQGQGLQPVGLAPVMPRNVMMELLGVLQKQQYQQYQQLVSSAAHGVTALPGNDLHINVPALLDALLIQRARGETQSLGKVEDDVINLVQMLFQFILEDRNLSETMKALIARLQIPMVKVALVDRTFFSKGGHPARKLLNELATAALGWMPAEEGRRDPLLEKIVEVVEALLNDFVDDISIFERLLEDFRAFVELEKRRSSLVEQRIVDAEDGKARSETARQQVKNLIDQKLAGVQVPTVVSHLLNNAWSNVLFLLHLKSGPESPEFLSAVGTIDRLLWTVRPAECFSDRQQLLSSVPSLLRDLREGLATVSYNPFEMNKLFAELEAEHLQRIKAVRSQAKAALAAQPEPAPMPPAASVDAMLNGMAGAGLTPDAGVDTLPASLLNQVSAMVTGTWVEFLEGETRLRCRLAAKIKPTGKLIFVNRHGQKVAEHTAQTLAVMLQQGSVSFLDDGLLFDRALESVIGNLRDLKDKK